MHYEDGVTSKFTSTEVNVLFRLNKIYEQQPLDVMAKEVGFSMGITPHSAREILSTCLKHGLVERIEVAGKRGTEYRYQISSRGSVLISNADEKLPLLHSKGKSAESLRQLLHDEGLYKKPIPTSKKKK